MSVITTKGKGPVEADLGDFPWSALLVVQDRQHVIGRLLFCGGSLISKNEVLTHKNCIRNDSDRYVSKSFNNSDFPFHLGRMSNDRNCYQRVVN